MKRFQAGRLAPLFLPMLFVVGCTSSGNNSAANLGQRMQVLLAPDIAAGRAGLEQLPDGARVTLPERMLFPPGRDELDDKGRFLLASVIQGLLDPGILRIDVTEPAPSPAYLQGARASAVRQYFVDYGLGPVLQPAAVPPGSVDTAPQDLMITVSIVSS
jgi:flagellar motor protein MotB